MTHPAHSPRFLLLVATFLASAAIFGHILTPEWLAMATVLLGAAWLLVWWTPYRWRFIVATIFAFVGWLSSTRPGMTGRQREAPVSDSGVWAVAADSSAVPSPYTPDGCLVMSNGQLVPCRKPSAPPPPPPR